MHHIIRTRKFLRSGTLEFVGLGYMNVPSKDVWYKIRVKLGTLFCEYMHILLASKDTKTCTKIFMPMSLLKMILCGNAEAGARLMTCTIVVKASIQMSFETTTKP